MEEQIIEIISKFQGINKEKINIDSNLTQDIGLSSFDVISLVCEFEEELNVEIPDREVSSVRTVRDIVDLINKLKNK